MTIANNFSLKKEKEKSWNIRRSKKKKQEARSKKQEEVQHL